MIHDHVVGLFVLRSLRVKVVFGHDAVALAEKSATGDSDKTKLNSWLLALQSPDIDVITE